MHDLYIHYKGHMCDMITQAKRATLSRGPIAGRASLPSLPKEFAGNEKNNIKPRSGRDCETLFAQ